METILNHGQSIFLALNGTCERIASIVNFPLLLGSQFVKASCGFSFLFLLLSSTLSDLYRSFPVVALRCICGADAGSTSISLHQDRGRHHGGLTFLGKRDQGIFEHA